MMLSSTDMVREILRRVDGTTLAMAATACKDLDSVSKDESLWENACRSLWPSIWMDESLKSYVSSSSFGGFRKLYSHCYPCPSPSISDLHDSQEDVVDVVKLCDFVCAIDVRYGEESVLSKVINGEHMCPLSQNEDMLSWFLHSPFGVSVTEISHDTDEDRKRNNDAPKSNNGAEGLQNKKETIRKMMRVSWILIDKQTGCAINLSTPGWTPFDVRSSYEGGYSSLPDSSFSTCSNKNNDFFVKFGSIVGRHGSFKKPVRCVVQVNCKLLREMDKIKVMELGFHFEYVGGGHLSGIESIEMMNMLFGCRKSTRVEHALGLQNEMVRVHDMTIHGKQGGKQAMEGVASLMSVMVLFGFWIFVLSKFLNSFLR